MGVIGVHFCQFECSSTRLLLQGSESAYDGESASEANRQFTLLVNQSEAARSKCSAVRVTLFSIGIIGLLDCYGFFRQIYPYYLYVELGLR